MFEVVLCRIARLHLLPQITPRQSSPPGSLVDPFAAQLACRGEISEMPHGILSLRYNQCRNGFRLLRQRECKRNGSWTSAEIFQNNVCGSAVPCCPASSATADYAAAVFPSGFARRSICCATGLPRRNLRNAA